ncbi:MAG: MBL fold metallo-hydrolase [Bdellovibrionales bacterium]|jgi:phosphoribosyl 1,2-cyclic phosphate phosphodiesterase|nr:MBL fold metallo-hydrolase [Bdellovibrionales bacterium]
MNNKVTFLGTGTSTGVPVIGCHCQVCKSENPHNKRLRTSIIVQTKNNKTFLVDTTPDLRMQLLSNSIEKIDFVLLTHEHADHLHGIDDLRPLCFSFNGKELPFYALPEYENSLKNKFPYIFNRTKKKILGGGVPLLKYCPIILGEQIIEDVKFNFFLLPHGRMKVLGFQHDKMAYIIDCHEIPIEIITYLRGQNLELLIIDCLQEKKHSTHLSRQQAFDYIEEISPKKASLIHIGHYLEHEELKVKSQKITTSMVEPAFDQLSLEY